MMDVPEAKRNFTTLRDRVHAEEISADLDRGARVIARMIPPKPRSPMTLGKLNEFLRNRPPVADGANESARDVLAILAEFARCFSPARVIGDTMTILDFEPLAVAVPLREEPAGVLRVGNSRVLLELVIRAFKAGATPEAIVQSYETLRLAHVYAVVSRYLAAPEPFEEYLRIRDEAATKVRKQIEEFQGPQRDLRATLLARAKAREGARAQAGNR